MYTINANGSVTGRGDLLTVRELSRIQGIPDDFEFYGSESCQYRQVIDAIPLPIATKVANAIVKVIRDFSVDRTEDSVGGDESRSET